jgi:hypothetical protein
MTGEGERTRWGDFKKIKKLGEGEREEVRRRPPEKKNGEGEGQ